jgi:hypothetical protein
MSDLYFLYDKDADLNEADPLMSGRNTAFALKEDNRYDVYALISYGSLDLLQGDYTESDARDYMNDITRGDFYMFKVRTGLTLLQTTETKSIINEYALKEGWPENVLTEMKSRGFLDSQQKEDATTNRRNCANVPHTRPHSQTNGA